jgi:hypothetical protein
LDNSFGLQYFSNIKTDSDFYFGGGFGYQKFPYAFGTIGINQEHFEIGAALLLGYSSEKISYDGYSVDEDGRKLKDGNFSEERYRCSSYSSAYLYTSFYLKHFALNYAASVASPIADEIYNDNSCLGGLFRDKIFSFDFPVLLMQDIGVAYTNNHIRYRVGLNQITGVKFPGQYYRGTAHTAWLF